MTDLAHALEIRSYPGTGSLWFGRNSEFADASFTDWGLARATATILNAAHRAARAGQASPARRRPALRLAAPPERRPPISDMGRGLPK
jgi:hypothetical protein